MKGGCQRKAIAVLRRGLGSMDVSVPSLAMYIMSENAFQTMQHDLGMVVPKNTERGVGMAKLRMHILAIPTSFVHMNVAMNSLFVHRSLA